MTVGELINVLKRVNPNSRVKIKNYKDGIEYSDIVRIMRESDWMNVDYHGGAETIVVIEINLGKAEVNNG